MLFEIARETCRCFLHIFIMVPVIAILMTPVVVLTIVSCSFGFESYLIDNRTLDKWLMYITKPIAFMDTIDRHFR